MLPSTGTGYTGEGDVLSPKSGSDCNSIEQVGRAATEFVNSIYIIDDIIEQIQEGRLMRISIQ
ncbi:MAG: hypothetical protein JRJ70_17360 [Deltaproteobacteria bacterium]|nr:hypothetical protein [Deltaproteobacteria bacterium]